MKNFLPILAFKSAQQQANRLFSWIEHGKYFTFICFHICYFVV